MHICTDEILGIVSLIPFVGYFAAKLRVRFADYKRKLRYAKE